MYNENGFPIFETYGTAQISPEDYMSGRDAHKKLASLSLYEQIQLNPELAAPFSAEDIESLRRGLTPADFIWHHHQDAGVMQLVDQAIHGKTWHRGGFSIWGK